jgi:hypothetical protein
MKITGISGLAIVLAALLVCGSGRVIKAQNFQFKLLDRGVIEDRLRMASKVDSEREQKLKELFEVSGCGSGQLTELAVKHRGIPNLSCKLAGSTDSLILVAGHMDHVTKGLGVVDDWSGAALLPSLFESLQSQLRRHTFVFIGFTDEEDGLVGSRSYVKQMTEEQLGKIRAMVNLECLGLGSPEVWGHHADPELMKLYGSIVHTLHLPFTSANVEKVGYDDADSFRASNVPTITIHSLTQETWSILHSPRDDFPAIHWNDYYDTYHMLAAYLAFLDEALR